MNKLKVNADFCSSGIWNEAGHMLDYDNLPVPLDNELIDEFKRWIDYYDTCFEKDFSTFKPGKSEKLNQWGQELAVKLKEKMGSDWEITYQGEDESGDWDPKIV